MNYEGKGRTKMTVTVQQFAADPFADHSARFPLGRTRPLVSDAAPSNLVIRPWGLRGMSAAKQQDDPVREAFSYDHDRQIAVDENGVTLSGKPPTADSKTDSDGDEGRSEDWTYDYCPDSPDPAV